MEAHGKNYLPTWKAEIKKNKLHNIYLNSDSYSCLVKLRTLFPVGLKDLLISNNQLTAARQLQFGISRIVAK